MAVALYVLHIYILDLIDLAPRFAVMAPEKQCGKKRVLECLNLITYRPLMLCNGSPASLVRITDIEQPTLLLDEIDRLFGPETIGDHQDLRSLINAGYRKLNRRSVLRLTFILPVL